MEVLLAWLPSATLAFGTLGASIAAVNHARPPFSQLRKIVPAAFDEASGKVDPVYAFWGGYAVAACSAAHAVMGVAALASGSLEAQRCVLFGLATLFFCYSAAWSMRGDVNMSRNGERDLREGARTPSAVARNNAIIGSIFVVGIVASSVQLTREE